MLVTSTSCFAVEARTQRTLQICLIEAVGLETSQRQNEES